jgi:hypothetical protein
MPIAGLPALRRALINAAEIFAELVSVNVTAIGAGLLWLISVAVGTCGHGRRQANLSRASISVAPTGPSPRFVQFRLARQGRPVVEDRVENLPRQLDLLVLRKQGRVAEQHVEDQPLVRLRG